VKLVREVETRREHRYALLGVVLWFALTLGAGAAIAAILGALGGCGSSAPQVVERVVTVPVREPCAPPAPILKSVPEPKCTPEMNPQTCTWPTPQAAQDFIANIERAMEYLHLVASQCAQSPADAGP